MAASNHVDFSLSLHHRLAPATDRDFCWSPYSVASALGLAAAAAGGRTRREILGALRVGDDDLTEVLELLKGAAELDEAGAGAEDPVLAVANTLWADGQLPLEDSYVRELSNWPGGAVRGAPFRTAPEQARQEINTDVARTTRDLIPELIAPGMVDSDTVAALVNALYLKTSWTEAFDEQATRDLPFHAPEGTREVPTMRVTSGLGYAARDGWQVVTLPAEGGLEAVVLLPDDGLARAEPRLDAARIEALVSATRQQRVDLSMPKFEATGEAELQGALGELGARTLFTPDADFAPLTPHPLRVSAVLHQSVLRVDESGFEGAAATAVMMRLMAAGDEPEPIRGEVNRPFLFLGRPRGTRALPFLARVVAPS